MVAEEVTAGPFLERLANATRRLVVDSARARQYAAGARIFEAGNSSLSAVVVSGLVRSYSETADGQGVTHEYVRPGDVIGLGALIGTHDEVSAEAVVPSRLLLLDHRRLEDIRNRDVAFNIQVGREIHRRLEFARRRQLLRLRGSLSRRLAGELLDRAADAHTPQSVLVAASHEELAEALGSSREVVTRSLRRLSRVGMVKQVGRGRIALMDTHALLDHSLARI